MPFHDHHEHEETHHDHQPNSHHGGGSPPKANPKLLSLLLKAIIMAFITTLFFLFLGVAAILLALATAAFHLHNNHHSHRRSSLPPVPPSGLPLKDLKKIPQFRVSKPRGSSCETECVICLDAVTHGQWCRRLPRCGHVFHRRCLDSWLVKVPSCPVCRTRVRSGNLLLEEDRVPVPGFDRRNDLGVWWN